MFIIAAYCLSCAAFKSNVKCKLIPEQNKILGNKKEAKIFVSNNNNYYLPVVIEQLLHNNSNVKSNYQEPLPQYAEVDSLTGEIRMVDTPKAKSKLRGGYKIEGCLDTTWAKNKMAEHLLEKYKLSRLDSFFITDIFTYSLYPDSIYLLKSQHNSNIIIGIKTSRGYQECTSCSIETFIGNVLDMRGYKFGRVKGYKLIPDQSFHDLDFLVKGKFDFRYYFKEFMEMDPKKVASSLRKEFGILLTHEKIDTIKMGYYILDE